METVVLTEGPSPVGALAATGHPSHSPASSSHRRSAGAGSGAGSPGAAPSSPRDVRAAAAAAAALGAAAPAITSYFCMALVIDVATTAAGAAAAGAAAGAPSPARSGAGGATAGAAADGKPHVALWARHAAPLLLQKQQRRVAAPVLWLFTATVEPRAGGTICRLHLHLHAVRGLAAIVMSAGYGGSLSSTSGGSSSTRPAAVLWGQHSWDLPAGELAGASLPQLLQRLCCWVSDEEGYPLLHAFTSAAAQGSGRLLLAGRTFATVQEDGPLGSQVGALRFLVPLVLLCDTLQLSVRCGGPVPPAAPPFLDHGGCAACEPCSPSGRSSTANLCIPRSSPATRGRASSMPTHAGMALVVTRRAGAQAAGGGELLAHLSCGA